MLSVKHAELDSDSGYIHSREAQMLRTSLEVTGAIIESLTHNSNAQHIHLQIRHDLSLQNHLSSSIIPGLWTNLSLKRDRNDGYTPTYAREGAGGMQVRM